MGALMISSFVILKPDIPPKGLLSIVIMIVVYGLSYLMISNIPYRSFKDIDLREKKSAKVIFFISLFMIIILLEPSIMIFSVITIYILSGIIGRIIPFRWNIGKTISQDILIPPEDFDDLHIGPVDENQNNEI